MKILLSSLFSALMLSLSPEGGPKSVHDFTMKSIEGKEISLGSFKGKKLLIVNVASRCGYTKQYKDLEALYQKYGSKVVVLGFPANNFGGQEPGSDAEIKGFCEKNYSVSFPMFSKISVKGKDRHALYEFLSDKEKNGSVSEAPGWNFCKYLVDENGKVLKYFPSSVNPMDKEITDLL
jgi:glutathione peroxidase